MGLALASLHTPGDRSDCSSSSGESYHGLLDPLEELGESENMFRGYVLAPEKLGAGSMGRRRTGPPAMRMPISFTLAA